MKAKQTKKPKPTQGGITVHAHIKKPQVKTKTVVYPPLLCLFHVLSAKFSQKY